MSDYSGECGCDECAEIRELTKKLAVATGLLREWRDRHGGKEHYTFGNGFTASPTDLLRDTQRFLEGK